MAKEDILANGCLANGCLANGCLANGCLASNALQRTIRYAIQRQEAVSENQRLLRDLRDSKRLLEAKNRRLEELCDTAQKFVDNVSHEFRTPLTVIKEYASLIRDGLVGEVNDEQQRMLNVIEDRGGDLNTMVDDMLDVSRFKAGLLSVWRREAHLDQIVRHVMPALERKAQVRNVSIDAAIAADLPVVYCDEEKVGRVIINLVVNAIKFCGDRGVVRVWARPDNERRELVVGVTDNGPGIPRERRDELFGRFSQLATKSRQSTKGFGLGLSISKELVDLSLGRMSVRSAPGKGSTFMFSLPYAEPREVFRKYVSRILSLNHESLALSFVAVTADEESSPKDLDDVDMLVNQILRRDDVVFRAGDAGWLVVLHVPLVEVGEFVDRTRQAHADVGRNRPVGPLPEIDINVLGTWYLDGMSEVLLDTFSDYLSELEPCYA